MQNLSKIFISLIILITISSISILSSCSKDETKEMEYVSYDVDYLLTNNLNTSKRFTIKYYDPKYANNSVVNEVVSDTFWVRGVQANSLDVLFISGESIGDTSDFRVSIYVDAKEMVHDSAACNWGCDTLAVINYALP